MADSKNYIVRYDIQANTTEAATALESLVKKANEVAAPMKRLQSTLQNTSKALFHLRQNSKFEFNPSINTVTFQSQLRSMLQEVRTVATQMHAAIYEALSASPVGTKTAQTGIKNAFKLASTTPELQKQLAETEKFLQQRNEQLKRFSRTFSQSLTQEQKANAEKQRAIAKADRDMLKERVANIKAALAAQEEVDKKLVAQQEKTKKAVAQAAAPVSKVKTSASPKPIPTTNVTPAVIREWGKVFGDAKNKSLTVNIRGNASGAGGALTVIEQVMTSLKTLQSQATFNITPIINNEAFAAAEARLRQLAALSASVVAPFTSKENKTTGKKGSPATSLTKDEKTKLSNAQKQIKAWNEKIAPIQSRLDANKAIPENQRTPAIKGQITRDTKTLTSYTANRAEQEKIVSTLQNKSTAAIQAGARPAQPLAVDIVGNLTKINTPVKPPVIPIIGEISKIQGKISEAIPVNVKISGDQVAASLKAVTPPPMLDVRVHILPEGIQEQIQAISSQVKPVSKTPTKPSAPITSTPTPAPAPRPVYTPPTFTADDEKQLNNLATRYGNLAKAKEKAEKAVAAAKARLDKSGGSNKAYDNYLSAQRKLHDINRQSSDVFNRLNPLMRKQFQSTAQRALTDEEIVKGIGAQNIVKQFEGKKRLTEAQKTQLAEANKTLTALRAPAQPPMSAQPGVPVAAAPPIIPPKTPAETPAKPAVASQTAKSKKAPAKTTITGNVDTKDIIKQIQSIPKQTIPVAVKLMWEKGAIGRQGQLKKLAEGMPPMPIVLDTSGALGQLEEFIALVKKASPQTIQLTANGTPVKGAPATSTPIPTGSPAKPTKGSTEKKGKTQTTSVTPTAPKGTGKPIVKPASQIQTIPLNLDTSGAIVQLNEFISLIKKASPQTIQLTANGTPTKGAPAFSTPLPADTSTKSTKGSTEKKTKTHSVSSTPTVPKGTSKPTGKPASATQTIPLELNITGAVAKLEEFIALVKKASPQTIQLTANGTPTSTTANNQANAKAPSVATPPIAPLPTGGSSQKSTKQSGHTGHQPLTSQEKYDKLKTQSEDRARKQLADNKFRTTKRQEYNTQQQAWYNQQQALYNKLFGAASKPDPNWIYRQEQQRAAELTKMREDARTAFAKPTPFEQEEIDRRNQFLAQQEEARKISSATSISSHKNKLGRMQSTIRNSILPFVRNQDDLESIFKNYKSFKKVNQAWGTKGVDGKVVPFTPTPTMPNSEMLRYLTAVRSQMHTDGAAVPVKLNNFINNLQEQIRQSTAATAAPANMLPPSGFVGSGKNRVSFGTIRPSEMLAPNGYHWEKTKNLASRLSNPQMEGFQRALAEKEAAWQNLRNVQTSTQSAIDAARAVSDDAMRSTMLAQPMAKRREAKTAYTQARKNVNAYTNGYQLAPDESAKPSKTSKPAKVAHRVRTQTGEVLSVDQLRAQAQNAMLPFAQNKEQLNILTKHRRFFRQAVAATGIMPTPGMEAPRMLRYLQGVSTQMQQASVAVPWTLQSQINKLEDQVAASKGIGQSPQSRSAAYQNNRMAYGGRPMSFYDRSRKWAYPFTGPSSFGVRTPMAVDMAKGMGVMFAIGGAMSAIGGSFSQAMEYQNTMRTTQAILQNGTESYSQGSFQNMEATVRNVGVKTKFSAPEVANAAKFLAMAGYDINAINDAIRPIADLALIGDSDLGETADKMTNIMTTFNIAPERMRQAANIMATTATRSNTDLMMLAESAKYGGGVAHMYGHNDPNLFADTMALFGVMGNAGIQASSAGTSLRMMYQNIFNPNKKQAALLNLLESQYGISTKTSTGEKRSMADIIIDMANKIPANVMPDIVGKLFRITAQPGANAALLSATDIAMQESGGDVNAASNLVDETNAFVAKLSGKNSKSQLSSLAALIQANRNSMNGNISGAIAEEKQNTIQGLWAQVTSTFTEGIVQSFEHRQGGFEEILKKLRDYFAKPETVQMLQNLMDMIIEIGKVMGWFVKIWASLYNAAPGMIKFWVVTQMAVTQMGTLIAPFISLLGVVNRLQRAIGGFAGVTAIGGASGAMGRIASTSGVVAGGAATTAAMNAPFIVGHTPKGKPKVISGNIAKRAHQAVAANARKVAMQDVALASSVLLPYPGGNTRAQMNARVLSIPNMVERQNKINALNTQTQAHYAAVKERARRIYGPARAGRAFKSAFYALPTLASFSPMLGGIKSMMMGLFTSLAKAVGFLVNPVTLAVGALAGLGFGLYKLKQRIDGNTDAQKASRAQANRAADQTSREMAKEGQWYKDLMNDEELLGIKIPEATPVISSIDINTVNQAREQKERFEQLYATIFNNFSKGASKQSVKDVATKWQKDINSNPAYSLAIGNAQNYDFSKKHQQLEYNPYNAAANVYIGLHNARYANEDEATNQRQGMVQDALMIEGANDARTQQAIREITELRRKYLDGKTQFQSQSEFLTAAQGVRDKYMSQFTANIPAAGMTPEQFKENRDRSVFDTYQLGARNLLDATIEGKLGTTIGMMNAYEWLSDTKNKAQRYSDAWYNAIANIIGNYHATYMAISGDGKQAAQVELILSTLPNGQLNFDNILAQINGRVDHFKSTVQGFSDIIGEAYKKMAEAGVIDIKDRNDFRNQILHNLNGAKFNDETPRTYYQQWIGKNKNSEWIKAGISEEKYIDFIMGRSGKTLNLGNRVVSLEQERKQMWRNIAGKTADTILEQNKGLTEQSKKLSENSPANTSAPTQTPIKDQQAYASAYNHSAAKPTQIVFNINNLASFDRTTVASSAEERDLMAAMEERIAGAVYQIFAEASNQAQRVMDLT